MKQQQMLILGIVMLMIFMVMMPTHKQQSQTVSAADIKKYSDPNRVKECKKQKCKDLGGNLIGPGKERYLKENFDKWCWKKDSACLRLNGDCNKCCSRDSEYYWNGITYCT
jgi:hypothetical protein